MRKRVGSDGKASACRSTDRGLTVPPRRMTELTEACGCVLSVPLLFHIRKNVTDLKGTFEWDYTPAGEYAFLPCPNRGWLEEYFPTAPPMMVAYRPCYPPTVRKGLRQLFYEGAFWGEPVTDICRWSSETTWMLDDIRKAIREEILDMIRNTPSNNFNSNNVTRIIYHLREASLLINSVPTDYLTEVDVLMVASVIDTSVSAGVEGLYTVTSELGQEVVNLADRILDI
ncbi:uncharacterized protein LOC115926192 [Strongylocentrotus purpuratus]|uniref:Uncharacterized protein n=1 Tax=Strongylocentrotus purpuratus TaxID=7668 RepID=A0A7M7P671_STRPU|nr:uncharacterized protein LOC115926192 [Strongylocentrotus purpuratus]